MKRACKNGHKWYDDEKYGGNIICPVCQSEPLPPPVDHWKREKIEHLKPWTCYDR